jgi:DNA-binding NtrC family response regulator
LLAGKVITPEDVKPIGHGGEADVLQSTVLGQPGGEAGKGPLAEVPSGQTSFGKLQLMVVEDDLPVLKACCEIATGIGFQVYGASTVEEARDLVLRHALDVVLMDLKLPGGGLLLLEEVRSKRPRSAIVVMTAFATVSSAVEAMRIGATDYLTKPFAMDELTSVLDRAGERRQVELESHRLQTRLPHHQAVGAMIGASPEMEKLHRILTKVAFSTHPVLILGESGTGKEMVARLIHNTGPNATRRFSVIECGQLAPAVLESELFGYARNPVTGSTRPKDGILTSQEGGTLFLDGVSELPLDLQSRLLRALQDKEVRPAGATQSIPVTVRVLAASSRNLSAMVDGGLFRKDLFYRLNVVSLRIPPLRERGDDIPLLAEHFLDRMRRESGIHYVFAADAIETIRNYVWPGNVRELENAIERACALSSGPVLHMGDMPSQMQRLAQPEAATAPVMRVDERVIPDSRSLPGSGRPAPAIISIAELEREAILNTIRQLHGDKLMAAKLLGIGKTTLYRKLKEYGISES